MSETSPITGDATDAAYAETQRAERPLGPLEIELELSRQNSIGWALFGVIVGGLLIFTFGTVGVWAGIVLVAVGAYHTWRLTRTFRHPPGTIVINEREIVLPRGLCVPDPVKAAPADVSSVYLLRRSVPWNHAAPVLVVELGERAMAFPRDWFASEVDQRRVIHHLRAVLRDRSATPAVAAAAAAPSSDRV